MAYDADVVAATATMATWWRAGRFEVAAKLSPRPDALMLVSTED